jgi:hypothetical protein
MTNDLKLDNPHGLFMKQTNLNVNNKPLDKYAKYDHDGEDSDEFPETQKFDENEFISAHKELL